MINNDQPENKHGDITKKRMLLIEKIKTAITQMLQYQGVLPEKNVSTFLSKKLCYDYTYLANIFSGITGETIEQYLIKYKIEYVKVLLLHSGLTLTDISTRLHYSSVSHLSTQFKKVTGTTPSLFLQECRQ
jgi:AraC-like DNA-binding protein